MPRQHKIIIKNGKIIKYFGSTINVYSLLSYELWVPP